MARRGAPRRREREEDGPARSWSPSASRTSRSPPTARRRRTPRGRSRTPAPTSSASTACAGPSTRCRSSRRCARPSRASSRASRSGTARPPTSRTSRASRRFPFELDPLQLSRREMARWAQQARDLGIDYIGSCCGSVAIHVREMARALGKLPRRTAVDRRLLEADVGVRVLQARGEIGGRLALEKSLPSEYYLSAEIFEQERERIFSREWFCAGRADTLPEAGEVRVLDVLGESLLLARTREGRLAAHYNVCRHRGARLCAADGAPPANRTPLGRRDDRRRRHPLPVPRLDVRPRRQAPRGAVSEPGPVPARRRTSRSTRSAIALWGGFFFLNLWPAGPRRPQLRAGLGAVPGAGRAAIRLDPLRPARRIVYDVARQLEGRRRELQRVLPLRGRPSRALRGRSGVPREGRRGPRLGARHSAPRRRLHVHAHRNHDRAPVPGPLGGGEGPAQGRARLPEPLPLALARPRRGVPPRCPEAPGPDADLLRLPLRRRRRWRSPASTRPTPSSSGT